MARSRRSRTPTLTAEVVADDEQLALVIDEFISMSPDMRAHRWRGRQRQREARRSLDDDDWLIVLALDDAHVERLTDLTRAIGRWAFREGRRQTGRRRRGPKR